MNGWLRAPSLGSSHSTGCAAGLPKPLRARSEAFVLQDGAKLIPYLPEGGPSPAKEALARDTAVRLRGLVLKAVAERALERHPACKGCARFHECPPVFIARTPPRWPDQATPRGRERRIEVELGKSNDGAALGALFRYIEKSPAIGVVRGRVACARLSPDGGRADFEPGTAEPHEAADRAAGLAVRARAADLPARSGRPDYRLEFERAPRGRRHLLGKLATIFVLRRCIARCVMCHVQDVYKGDDMPLWRIFGLLEELRMLGYDRIDYFGGEPTLREDLPAAISAAARLGCHTDIITNGMTMTRAMARRLRDAGLRLAMVSLDGPKAGVHDAIRKVPRGFERATAGIRALVEVARLNAADPSRRLMEVNIDTVVLPDNMDMLEEQLETAAGLGATHVNFFLCVSAPLLAHRPMWLDKPSAERLFREILPRCRRTAALHGITFTMSPDLPAGGPSAEEKFIDEVSRGIYGSLYSGGATCAAPRDEIYVTLHGTVFPCTSPTMLETKHAMGNAFESTLTGIVAGPEFERFAPEAGRHEECRMCWRGHSEVREETRYLGASGPAKGTAQNRAG